MIMIMIKVKLMICKGCNQEIELGQHRTARYKIIGMNEVFDGFYHYECANLEDEDGSGS